MVAYAKSNSKKDVIYTYKKSQNMEFKYPIKEKYVEDLSQPIIINKPIIQGIKNKTA